MSFGFGLSDFLVVLAIANDLRRRFVDSPKQFSAIADETKSLAQVLQELDDISQARDLDDPQERRLLDICRTCKAVLNELEAELDKYQDLRDVPTKSGTRIRRVWKKLTFDAGSFSDLRARLVSNTTLLTAFHNGLISQDTLHVRHVVDRLETHQDDLARQEIIDWLSNANHKAQYDNLQRIRQPGTGQWLLTSQEFQDWSQCKSQTLFCPGLPGAGKSMSACAVIEHLSSLHIQDPTIGFCFLFFEYRRADEQHLSQILAAILQQLLYGLPNLPPTVHNFKKHSQKKSSPSVNEYLNAIKEVLNNFQSTFIVIDALDECKNSEQQRNDFLETILDLQRTSVLQIFATSRFIPEVESYFKGKPSIEVKASDEDVKSYLTSQMRLFPAFVQRDTVLQKEVSSTVSKRIDGIFLLARLHIDSLRFHISAKALKSALAALPQGPTAPDTLRKAYDDARSRIEQQPILHVQLVKNAFSWITYFAQPLTTKQLLHGLAVDSSQVFDPDGMPDIDVLLSSSAGLLTVDEQTDIIGFIHYTTQEYVESIRGEWLPDGQERIVISSLWYFSLDDFQHVSDHEDDVANWYFWATQDEFPLLWPALYFFGTHASPVNIEAYQDSAIEFFTNERHVRFIGRIVSAGSTLCSDIRGRETTTHSLDLQTGARLAAYWGLKDLLLELFKSDGVTIRNDYGALLNVASREGWGAIVDWLLTHACSSFELQGTEALCSATFMGRDVIANMLTVDSRIDVNLNSGLFEEIPLHIAIAEGRHIIFELLILRDDLDVNKRERFGRVPLIEAVGRDDYFVKRLLQRPDINVNLADYPGNTALHHAAYQDRHDIVSALLTHREIDTSIRNRQGDTALDIAREWKSIECAHLIQQHAKALANAEGKTLAVVGAAHTTSEESKTVEQGTNEGD